MPMFTIIKAKLVGKMVWMMGLHWFIASFIVSLISTKPKLDDEERGIVEQSSWGIQKANCCTSWIG